MDFLPIFFFVGIFVFIIVFTGVTVDGHKDRIRREVLRYGGEVIDVSSKYWGGSKGGYKYNVSFSDPYGNKHHTICMVNGFNNSELFWTKTPNELMARAQLSPATRGPTAQMYVEPSVLSSKEQIIEDLHQENMRLQEQVARLREYKE